MKRREFLGVPSGAAAWPITSRAQQAHKVRTVGYLYPGPLAGAPPRITALLSGLRASGFREPEDVEILARLTEGDPNKLAPMAADLVAQKVDLVIAIGPAALRALRAATSSIPIVAIESRKWRSGKIWVVASISRPGGNVTGMFLDFPDFSKKWLELLKEAIPNIAMVAVLW